MAEWRRLDYAQWRLTLDDSESRQLAAEDGRRYSVVSSAVDDGEGRTRARGLLIDSPNLPMSAGGPMMTTEPMVSGRTG